MKIKRFKIIALVGVIIFQPFVLARTNDVPHDHAAHSHSKQETVAQLNQKTAKYTVHTKRVHLDRDTLDNRMKLTVTHDCGPCINGDILHCQCSAAVQMRIDTIVISSYSSENVPVHCLPALDAHTTSIFRPPITV